MEEATHTPITIHEISIEPNIKTLAKQFTISQIGNPDIYSEDVSSKDAPNLEQKLMSHPKLTSNKIIQLQKNDTFCNNIITHLHCNAHENYFTDAIGILHKKVIDFNSMFSSVVIPKILIKCLLHTSHHSLYHIGATKLYHFIKKFYYFQGMWKIIHKNVRTCKKCQIMNLQKPNYINLHKEIAQTTQDHLSINLMGPYNITAEGNTYTLTAICNLTGYLMTMPHS